MFTRLFKGRSARCRRCGVRIPRGKSSRYLRRAWCDRCLDLLRAEQQASEERTRSEALNLVGRWLDSAPTYQPTHPVRDAHRHAALRDRRPFMEPVVQALDFDDALDALTKLRLHDEEMFDDDWPAPFAWHMTSGAISFERRTRREFDRLAEAPDAALPRHLDALYLRTMSGSGMNPEAVVTTYFGSVYRSSDRVHVVWIEVSTEVVYG